MANRTRAAYLAALLLALLSLSGCGEKEAAPTVAMDKEHSYRAETISLDYAMDYIGDIEAHQGKAYVEGSISTAQAGQGSDGAAPGSCAVEIDLDTGEQRLLDLPLREDGMIETFHISKEGNLCYTETVFHRDEETGEDGHDCFYWEVTPALEEVESARIRLDVEDDTPSEMAVGADGNLYFYRGNSNTLSVYGKDGKEIASEEIEGNFGSLIRDSRDEILLSTYDDEFTTEAIQRVDSQAGSWEEVASYPIHETLYRVLPGNGSYPFYLMNREEMYGFSGSSEEGKADTVGAESPAGNEGTDAGGAESPAGNEGADADGAESPAGNEGAGGAEDLTEGEGITDDGTAAGWPDGLELVLNWVNCDVNGSDIQGICATEDGRILFCHEDPLTGEGTLMLMTKMDPSEVKDKKILTLARIRSDSLKDAVIAFNQQNEEYRVILKDYEEFYNAESLYDESVERFHQDLLSGNVPDILSLEMLDAETYASKGILEDLRPWMEKDEGFREEDYLMNVLEAAETDGKIYELIPSFQVTTCLAKRKFAGGAAGWTLEEMRDALSKMPEGAVAFDPSLNGDSVLFYALSLGIDQFVDTEGGECHFDDGEFASLLEFLKEWESSKAALGEGGAAEEEAALGEADYAGDKVLAQYYPLSSYEEFHRNVYRTFGGEEVECVGFPTTGRDGTALTPGVDLAISSQTPYKEGAWEFLSFFLGEEYQSSIGDGTWPVRKSCLAALLEKARQPIYYTDGDGNLVESEEIATIGGKEVNIGKITDEEAGQVDALLSSVHKLADMDEEIHGIVSEECAAFFEGQKTAEEVAGIVQNRVRTYLGERE